MVRPRKDPWGLSPRLRPWEAWGSLMDLCGRLRPVGPPRSSCDAYVGRVCHCHCGSDRRSRHPVRLVPVNGSFGCRTIAARTRDLILDTILAFTNRSGQVRSGSASYHRPSAREMRPTARRLAEHTQTEHGESLQGQTEPRRPEGAPAGR